MSTQIKPELVVEAARELLEQAEHVNDLRVAAQNPMTYPSAFGGQGGSADSGHRTSYTTGGIVVTGSFWWSDDETIIASETFTVGSDAPWAPQMHEKWETEVRNRLGETWSIVREMSSMKRIMMQVLVDFSDVDLANEGLIREVEV